MLEVKKAHAYGNDFLLVAGDLVAAADRPALARRLCDRHAGIGADGLILHAPTPGGARMELFNADGSPSEVSGNGVRCLATLVARGDPGAHVGTVVAIGTDAGVKTLTLVGRAGTRDWFRAAMGPPSEPAEVRLELAGEPLVAIVLRVGNPQCVVLGGPLDEARLHRIGPALEHHPFFPGRTNVALAVVDQPARVRILIWERGVGPTSSSGTGACAAAVAAAVFGGAARDVEVVSPGGAQRVEWTAEGLFLTGWAEVLLAGHWLA